MVRLLALCITVGIASTTCAGFSYTLELDAASFNLVEGDSVVSNMWLVETITPSGSEAGNILNSARGLSFNIKSDGTGFAILSAATPNAAEFNQIATSTGITDGFEIRNVDAITPATAAAAGAERRRVFAGTITILGASAGTTNLLFSDRSLVSGTDVQIQTSVSAPAFLSLDTSIFAASAPISVNVAAVPEPSTIVLAGIAGVGFLGRRLRKRWSTKC